MPNNKFTGKILWRNRFAFYLLAVGSACGLGNIWRFPYVAGENGGGAFILLYLFLAFTVGVSILIAELMLGKKSEASLLKITQRVSTTHKKPYFWISRLTLFITLVILSYYSVISGWVLHYITQFVVGFFRGDTLQYISSLNMKVLTDNGWLQFALASVHLIVAGLIVGQRMTNRFEKILTTFIIPVFVFLFAMLLVRSLSLDSTPEVLRFIFYPDFSKLNLRSLGHAIGHVFFTLSIGVGALVTFGSYFKNEDHLPKVGFRVMMVDVMISLFSVLLVFPIAFSIGEKPLTDPSLLFEALPRLFMKIQFGALFGLGFFICLWAAALNASVGLLETLASNYSERYLKSDRKNSIWLITVITLGFTVIPAFSGSGLKDVKLFDQTLLENIDSFLINYLLPISGLGMAFLFFKALPLADQKDLFLDEKTESSYALINYWQAILKFAAPILIAAGIILQIIALVRG